MKENLVGCFILNCLLRLVRTSVTVNQYQSQCCQTISVNMGSEDDGDYWFKGIKQGLPEFCVGDCVYTKAGSSDEFCFYEFQVNDNDVISQCLLETPKSSTSTARTETKTATAITSTSSNRISSTSSLSTFFTSTHPYSIPATMGLHLI